METHQLIYRMLLGRQSNKLRFRLRRMLGFGLLAILPNNVILVVYIVAGESKAERHVGLLKV